MATTAHDRTPDASDVTTPCAASRPRLELVRSPADRPDIGQILGGRYRVQRFLAEGAMGAVFEALDTRAGRRVAVKTMHAHLARHAIHRERFLREAAISRAIVHRNVVRVIDSRVDAAEPVFLVMEYLAGRPLRDLMRERGRLPGREVARIADQLLAGLEAVHARGIVHRDVKPANVFVAREEGDEVVKLLDFGIAGFASSGGVGTLTAPGDTLGTPSFMSPEQRAAGPLDGRSDLFSVGVLMYGMLCGRRPFARPTHAADFVRLELGGVTPASIYAPSYGDSGRLCAVIDRALAWDRGARFRSASEMRRALRAPRPRRSSSSGVFARADVGAHRAL